jgi:HK97 family phage major capsid protein
LLKTTAGEYLWSSPDAPIGMTGMWSVPAVSSPSTAKGQWLVGVFAQSCLLFSRQVLVVEISYEDQDNFVRNLVTIRAEERVGRRFPFPPGSSRGCSVRP